MKEEYKLREDGKIEYIFTNEEADFKPEILDKETIGVFYNTGITIMDSKSKAVELLEKTIKKTEDDLKGIDKQLGVIDISDSLALELKEFVNHTVKVMEAVKEIKDFEKEGYVANNPKKFGKMLQEARKLKENIVGELKEIDKVTGLHTRRTELTEQKKLFSEQLEKMKKQHQEVVNL